MHMQAKKKKKMKSSEFAYLNEIDIICIDKQCFAQLRKMYQKKNSNIYENKD